MGTGNLTVNSSAAGITANNNIAETNLTLSGDISAADITLNAGNTDNITQTGGTVQGANLLANTQGGNININNADFYSVDLNSNNGSASYADKDGFAIKANVGTGDLTIVAFDASVTADNNDPIAPENDLTINGDLTGDQLTVTNNNGNLNLIDGANRIDFNSLTANASGTIDYADADGIALVGSSKAQEISIIAGNNENPNGQDKAIGLNIASGASVTATNINLSSDFGNITQAADSTMQGQNLSLTLANTGDSANITNADFSNLSGKTNNGNITYSDIDGINLNDISLGNGDLNITASSDIANPADNGIAETDLTLSGIISGDDTSLSTNSNNITQLSGSIEGDTLTLSAKGGTVSIGDNGQADFATITGDLQGGDLDYFDLDGVLLSDFNGSTVSITIDSYINKGIAPLNLNGDPNGLESDLNLNGNISTDNLILTALGDGHKITQLGGQAIGDNLTLSSNGGEIKIGELGDADFTNVQGSTNGANATYIDTDGVNVQDFSVGNGDLHIITSKNSKLNDLNNNPEADLTLDGNIDGKNIMLEARSQSQNISQISGQIIGENLILSSVGGKAEIGLNGNADFATIKGDLQDGNLNYIDTDGLLVSDFNGSIINITTNKNTIPNNLNGDPLGLEADLNLNGNISADDLILTALGNGQKITQLGGQAIGSNLILSSNGGNIQIGNSGNADFATINGQTKGGNLAYSDTDGITLNQINTGSGNLNIISSKTGISNNLNGDPLGAENNINLNGNISANNITFNAKTNDSIIQQSGVVTGNYLNLITNTGNAVLMGQNNIVNLKATSNSGNFYINDLFGLNLLPSNVGTGILQITTSGNINLLGNLNGGLISLNTTNNGDINLFNNQIKALSLIEALADGAINGLDRDNYPRLNAPFIILSGDKVGDINAPIGLGEELLNGYIIDRSNQTLLTPDPNHYFGYSAITKLLLNENAYFLYPIVISPLNNGFFTTLKGKDGQTPVIAAARPGKATAPTNPA